VIKIFQDYKIELNVKTLSMSTMIGYKEMALTLVFTTQVLKYMGGKVGKVEENHCLLRTGSNDNEIYTSMLTSSNLHLLNIGGHIVL
jgi:hypothetical protein